MDAFGRTRIVARARSGGGRISVMHALLSFAQRQLVKCGGGV
jgi:hypothetical protein